MNLTQEQVIAWAREAGMSAPREIVVNNYWTADYDDLERFATLAYEAGRESMKWDGIHSCHPDCQRPACVHTRKAVEAENEACAVRVSEVDADGWEVNMAAIIRARREQ